MMCGPNQEMHCIGALSNCGVFFGMMMMYAVVVAVVLLPDAIAIANAVHKNNKIRCTSTKCPPHEAHVVSVKQKTHL